MKKSLENEKYDTKMYPSDWRYSAAILGLVRYLRYHDIDFEMGEDYIAYNQSDVVGAEAEERYLAFVEYYFRESMHHCIIEDLLENPVLSEEQIKECNKRLQANTITKKVFNKIKYSPENKENILAELGSNRSELIKDTYCNGKSLYAKFLNVTKDLLAPGGKICRLKGYYVDTGRKTKTIAYGFDKNTYVYQDEPEFDYIPFAFSKTYEGFFINNNIKIELLVKANDNLQRALDNMGEDNKQSPRYYLFMPSQDTAAFLNYDVEVIKNVQDVDYYETMFVRKESTDIFEKVGKRYKFFTAPCRVENSGLSENNYIPVEKIVTDSVVNLLHLDNLIEILLKDQEKSDNPRKHINLISVLINVNHLIYGGENMDKKLYKAKMAAEEVEKFFWKTKAENKLNSYKQKLISAITFKDYGRFCEVLLQLSAYTGVPFDFAYDLFENFESNKNMAYAFINRLNGEYVKPENKEEK